MTNDPDDEDLLWTTQKPTLPGVYMYASEKDLHLLHLIFIGKVLHYTIPNETKLYPVILPPSPDGRWCGPLEDPDVRVPEPPQ